MTSHSEAVFTFTWTIENFSMVAPDVLESPLWVSDGLDKSTWYLEMRSIDEDNETFSVHLSRHGQCMAHASNPERISVNYTFEVGTLLPPKCLTSPDDILSYDFGVGDSGSNHTFERRGDLSDTFDVLTVRCCMWRNEKNDIGKITEEEQFVVSNLSLGNV